MKKGKTENLLLLFFSIEAIMFSFIYLIQELNVISLNPFILTRTQSGILSVLGVLSLFMIIGILFWQEWAIYGLMSGRIFIFLLLILSSGFDPLVLVIEGILLISCIFLCLRLIFIKLKLF